MGVRHRSCSAGVPTRVIPRSRARSDARVGTPALQLDRQFYSVSTSMSRTPCAAPCFQTPRHGVNSYIPREKENDQPSPMTQTKKGNAATDRPGITHQIQEKLGMVNWQVMGPKLLGVVCGMVLGGLLVFGLWPFHSPKNRVTWIAGGNGLHFGHHATILSAGKFQAAKIPADAPCSLEIWLVPALTG